MDDYKQENYESGSMSPETELPMQKRRYGCLRIFALLTAVVFLLLSYSGIIRLLKLPTLPLVVQSIQLNQNEDVRAWRTSVVAVTADDRRGTGVILSPGNHILTNAHIIEDASVVTIQFGSGMPSITTSEFVLDQNLDLCLINIQTNDNGLAVSEIPNLTESTSLYMIGNPLGYFQITSRVSYMGLVCDAGWPEPLIAVRGPIYKGNSGSPVIQADGEVIGLLFATTDIQMAESKVTAGLVIPASTLSAFLESVTSRSE